MERASVNIIILIIIAVVAGFVGYQIGAGNRMSGKLAGDGEGRYFSADELQKLKNYFPSFPGDVRSLSGTVRDVSSDTITLGTNHPFNPFEKLPDTYHIRITKETKIVKNEPKDSADYEREVDEYTRSLSTRTTGAPTSLPPSPPPSLFAQKEITREDIAVGDSITVETGENIKERTEFDAVRITVSVSPVFPAPIPPSLP